MCAAPLQSEPKLPRCQVVKEPIFYFQLSSRVWRPPSLDTTRADRRSSLAACFGLSKRSTMLSGTKTDAKAFPRNTGVEISLDALQRMASKAFGKRGQGVHWASQPDTVSPKIASYSIQSLRIP